MQAHEPDDIVHSPLASGAPALLWAQIRHRYQRLTFDDMSYRRKNEDAPRKLPITQNIQILKNQALPDK